MSTVLVTGATGQIGRRVVAALASAGCQVRALVRDRDRAIELLGHGTAELVVGGYEDTAAVSRAVELVDLALVIPPDEHVDLADRVSEAAAAAGVEHLVRISAMGADAEADSEILRNHGLGEARLEALGVRYTHVRCNSFYQNLTFFLDRIMEAGAFESCGGTAPVAWIDMRDVADVVSRILLEPLSHAGRRYELTGPQALTGPDIAAALSTALDARIVYRDLSAREFIRAATKWGWSDGLTQEWVAMFAGDYYGAGKGGIPTETAALITGRPPRRFADFADEMSEARFRLRRSVQRRVKRGA